MAQENASEPQDDKVAQPEKDVSEPKDDRIAQLERRLMELEQAMAQLIGTIKTAQAMQQTVPPPPPPTPVPSDTTTQTPPLNPNMLAALAPLLELFKPQGSKLDELVVGKALELLFRSTELNSKFMENLMETLSSALGKKTGERIAKVIAVTEE
jgi:hypothetical protein